MKHRIKILSILILVSLSAYSQDYLFIDSSWHNKINDNKELAPLFYGIEKSKETIKKEKQFVLDESRKHSGKEVAFDFHFKKAWNFFNAGFIDSAVIEFNNCYLINKEDLRLVESFGNLLVYVNGEPPIENLSPETFPNYTLWEIFDLQARLEDPYELMIAFGDNFYVQELKKIHDISSYQSFNEFKENIGNPFKINTLGNLCIKLRLDNDEGYYCQGKQNGEWIRYFSDTSLIDFKYYQRFGERDGTTTTFYRTGIKKSEFQHVNGNIHGEYNYYDENGELVKTDFWENNSMNSEKSIRYKDTPMEGDVFQEKDENGELHYYMIINGKKVLMR